MNLYRNEYEDENIEEDSNRGGMDNNWEQLTNGHIRRGFK